MTSKTHFTIQRVMYACPYNMQQLKITAKIFDAWIVKTLCCCWKSLLFMMLLWVHTLIGGSLLAFWELYRDCACLFPLELQQLCPIPGSWLISQAMCHNLAFQTSKIMRQSLLLHTLDKSAFPTFTWSIRGTKNSQEREWILYWLLKNGNVQELPKLGMLWGALPNEGYPLL